MSSPLAAIRRLQKVDARLDELDEELARLPKHIAEIEAKLEAAQAELDGYKAALEQNEKERRALEGQVQIHEQKSAQLETQMSEAKTNEQYRAFRMEISYARKEIKKAEDAVLDRMEAAQALQEKIAAAEAAVAEQSESVAKEIEETRAQFQGDEEEREKVLAKRAEVTKDIDKSALGSYDRVRKKLKSRAVSPLEGNRCTSCHMVVRPQLLQQLRSTGALINCEFCGCIIYLPEMEETPTEDPAGDEGIA